MAKPTTKRFGDFIVQVESADSPNVFAAPCGLTTKSFNQTASTNETQVPDCTDPDAAVNVERDVVSLSRELSGSGVMATESFTIWQTWYDSADARTCRVYPKGSTGGYYEGDFILSAFNLTAELGQKVNIDVTLQSDGACLWNAGP